MNILLVNPPAVDNVKIVREGRCMQRQEAWGTSWAPLTLAISAAILRDAGFTTLLKDCSNDDIDFDGLRCIIQEFRPEVVIVNTSTPSIDGDVQVAAFIKEIDKNIKTIFFGIHVTALPERILNENPDVEFIANGEPEYTIREFARAVKEKKPMREVKGLIYRDGDNIRYNEKRSFIDNLDELPDPAWDLVNINGYRLPITNRPFLLVLTSRGCPHSCTFCAARTFYGTKPRLRSGQRIVSEIKYVKDRYGINDFLFWSENGIIGKQHMLDICHRLAEEAPGVRWVCNARVDMVDEGLLKTMKKAGCWMIGYGVESGAQRILEKMKKNVTVQGIERAIYITKKSGIEVTAHVIIGYPGETKNDILNTLTLLKKWDPDYIQVYCCVPFPGSPLYDEVLRSGWLSSTDWAMFEQNFSVVNTPQLSDKEVMALRERIIKSFYLNPCKIVKTLLKIRSPREILFFLSFAKKYFASWANK